MADAVQGALTTGLAATSRGTGLASQAVITDGNWHRIAFTWDGKHRWLYVDGAVVAEDAQDSLAASYTDLLLGTGKTLAPAPSGPA